MAELTKDNLTELRRPFTAEALKWKVQANLSNGRGLCVCYIDARLVSERLNKVVGSHWTEEPSFYGERSDTNLMWCKLTVGGQTHIDVGEGSGKTGRSDALKRAAVNFGIGVPNYAVPQQILPSDPNGKVVNGKPSLRPVKKGQKTTLYITDACEAWLAQAYERWLDEHGKKAFGDPLDHGDVAGSVGDPSELAASEPEQESLEMSAKRAEIEEAYAAATSNGGDKRKLPPGRFAAELKGADSIEQLDRLAEKVAGLA